MKVARRTPGVGVRKPPKEETAGGVGWPGVRRYGDLALCVRVQLLRYGTNFANG